MAEEQVKGSDDDGMTKIYKGYRLPGPKFFKVEHIEASINYRALDDDIVLCAFPKTGNTWISYIIWMILHRGESYPDIEGMTGTCVPFMERVGIEPVVALKPPRFYKNHFAYGLMLINEKARYIYTYRKPEDVAISCYYFLKNSDRLNLDLDTFFENFIDGKLPYGDYFDHVLEAYGHRDDEHFLMISYETLKSNPQEEILRIAKFLGDSYYEYLKENDSLMKKILEQTSFDYMKKNLAMSIPTPTGLKPMNFFRKGVVGDGKATLSKEQLEKLHSVIRKKMQGTSLYDEWLS